MISKEQAAELQLLILKVRQADDFQNRYTYGHTNLSIVEIAKISREAKSELEKFITNITEE